jgi:hypothetical protein
MTIELQEIKNNFESKCPIKIETNSRGHNTTIHVYQGVTEKEIDDTIFKANLWNKRIAKNWLV